MSEETLTSELQPFDDGTAFAGDNRETMIKVDHVTMEFNMASEQLNSLKEYAIAIMKHKLYFEKFTALDDISFEVKRGDVFGILGTNGSGKSTLLKIIAGVLEPTRGSCEISGSIAPLIELGAGFDMELSARENIYLNGSLLGYSKQFIDKHFDDIVSFAEIDKFLDMPMKNYSSGMVARIAFAIATVIVPEILIVDEVLSVGDFMFQQKCENRINELIEKHKVTVLIVSHSNEQIERLCNKAIWIEKGHTRIMGDTTEVVELYRFLGGRKGSKNSEDVIYKALLDVNKERDKHEIALTDIKGNNSIEINLKQINYSWISESFESIALACNFTHTNAIMANGFCGALNIPVLPIGHSEFDPLLKEWICSKSPQNIYIFDRGKKITPDILQELFDLPFPHELVYVGDSLNMLEYSCECFLFGSSLHLWKDTIGMMMFDENLVSLSAGPLLYRSCLPLFFVRTIDDDLSDTIALLKEHSIKSIVILGNQFPQEKMNLLRNEGFEIIVNFDTDSSLDACTSISNFTIDLFNENKDVTNVIIANKSLSTWPDLLSTGCVGGIMNSPLILCDCGDLDSIAHCITSLIKYDFKNGFAISNESKIMDTERILFNSILLSNRI